MGQNKKISVPPTDEDLRKVIEGLKDLLEQGDGLGGQMEELLDKVADHFGIAVEEDRLGETENEGRPFMFEKNLYSSKPLTLGPEDLREVIRQARFYLAKIESQKLRPIRRHKIFEEIRVMLRELDGRKSILKEEDDPDED